MAEPFGPDELRAAIRLDEEIDRALSGSPSPDADPTVTWLAAALRTDPPASLAGRVTAERFRLERRALRPIRVAVALMAYLFVSHGVGNIAGGDWIARNLDQAHSPHASLEGGLALVAVGVVVAASLFRRAWLPVAVTAGVPLGLAFGLLGIDELGEFSAGAALHLGQAATAVFLGVAWWRFRRYRWAPESEPGA